MMAEVEAKIEKEKYSQKQKRPDEENNQLASFFTTDNVVKKVKLTPYTLAWLRHYGDKPKRSSVVTLGPRPEPTPP